MKFLKSVYILSIIFWIILIFSVISLGSDQFELSPYLINDYTYKSFSDLFYTLFLKVNNLTLFEKCCDIINFTGRFYGYSYQDMNIIIFVIFSPLFVLNLLLICLVQSIFIFFKKN